MLLLVVYVGFIAGGGANRGLLDIPTADGQNVRAAMLFTAAWFAAVRAAGAHRGATACRHRTAGPRRRSACSARTASCGRTGRSEWRRDRNVVYYLLASAVFRDGLTGVFTFGAVLGVNVYGVSAADVLLFGVSACVVAAVGAVLGGLLDDRFGSKPVIVDLAGGDDRRRADADGVVRCRWRSGCAGCCCACSSGRRCRRRAR